MTLDTVAAAAGLDFYFIADEQYDIAIREDSWDRPAVAALRDLLDAREVAAELVGLGFAR